jgi:2-polyprenyl-3-methyl-5-hydroxy-6-metoxy-1,4-benzoquinol methylase
MGLKDSEDAFGHGIYDQFKGFDVDEVIERDDGYIDVSLGPLSYLSRFDSWGEHEKKAMELAKGRVLDIGCGAGRHSIHLQNKGLDVLGIDTSPRALEVCRERGLKNTRLLSITEINASLGKFDTIIMMGNNFGLFASKERARRLLKRLYRMTPPDARLIAESTNPYDTDRPEHLEYHERNKKMGRMPGQVRIRVRYRKYKTPWFDYLLVSKDEMLEVLKGTDWEVETFIESKYAQYIAVIKKVR